MKTKHWLGQKVSVRLAAVAPHPDPSSLNNVCSTWTHIQRQNIARNSLAPTSDNLHQESHVFKLVPIEKLPEFNANKTLKTMLFDKDQIRSINTFRRQWRHVIAFMLHLGNLLMLFTVAAPRQFGRLMAFLVLILHLPEMLLIIGSIRIEMLYFLLKTYDFWYFTVNNVAFGICFSVLLSDSRIVAILVGCVIVQISISADALVSDSRQLFLSSVTNCGTHFAMFLIVFLRRVDDDGNVDAFFVSYSNKLTGVSIRDILMNAQFNMTLLFGRLVYNNWIAMREQLSAIESCAKSQTNALPSRRRCVSYYCTVGLQTKCNSNSVQQGWTGSDHQNIEMNSRVGSVVGVESYENMSSAIPGLPSEPLNGKSRKLTMPKGRFSLTQNCIGMQIQLHFVPVAADFDAHETLMPGFGSFLDRNFGSLPLNTRQRMLLHIFHILGYFGICTLVLGALSAWILDDQDLDQIHPGLAQTQLIAFFVSVFFCSVFFAAYQRQLLRKLFSSFNSLFLSAKLTTVSLMLCQFLKWDRRVLWVWSAWLWMQWAITLDALPPSSMRLLAFQRSFLVLYVLSFELFGLCCLVLELVAINRWIVPNIALVNYEIFGRHLHLSALSTLVSRLLTIFIWECRLLWFISLALYRHRQRHRRVVSADSIQGRGDERLLLTGRVEYFYELETRTCTLAAKSKWSRSFHSLRIPRAIQRRRAKDHLHAEGV
ncbi:hypothetical protein Plhal703r1_c06g0035381 [Plasmopara halstedii]